MKFKDLLSLPTKKRHFDGFQLGMYLEKCLSDFYQWDYNWELINNDGSLTCETIESFNIDGRRIWEVGKVYLRHELIFIYKAAGRSGLDHCDVLFRSKDMYNEFISYLSGYRDTDIKTFNLEDDASEYISFYGGDLKCLI